jgi:hypothetical protein
LPNAPSTITFSWPSGATNQIQTSNLTFFQREGRPMTPLTQYGRMAEKHWREHRPKMVRELQAKGLQHQLLVEAEEKTKDEMATLRLDLMKLGKTAQQAHTQAWEMVREKYILLPPET